MAGSSSFLSIIPGGCLQFVDISVDLSAQAGKLPLGRLRRPFHEEMVGHAGEQDKWRLDCLVRDDNAQFGHVNRLSGEAQPMMYEIPVSEAFRVFEGRWIPVPFLHQTSALWPDNTPRFEYGPTDWARCCVRRREEAGEASGGLNGEGDERPGIYDLTIVFDTAVEPRPVGQEVYHALSDADRQENAKFSLASHERDAMWFVKLPWVMEAIGAAHGAYLKGVGKKSMARLASDYGAGATSPLGAPALPVLEDAACYLTLLEALEIAGVCPPVRVVNPERTSPIEVDLVLDLGNSRLTGVIIETAPQRATRLTDSYLLQVRDLSRPGNIYSEPMDTRVEFSEASFGSADWSFQAGRLNRNTFIWPSPVRVGREASRLAAASRGAEGPTGMSSPKRYLWDERRRMQQWRFNGYGPNSQIEPPAAGSGRYMEQINDEGTPLALFAAGGRNLPAELRRQSDIVAFEAFYTRSSLMMFLLSEVIAQALVTINSPALRAEREHPDAPRHLRSIILTVPTAMPIAEQNIYRRWARWAVRMVWETLGWGEWYAAASNNRQPGRRDFRTSPQVRCDWDEATCTQVVWLYNELIEKYHGDTTAFFSVFGRTREEYAKNTNRPSLRIACVDVGGGTTDLSITTYTVEGAEASTARIKPHLNFRDGFNVAGDDVLYDIIAKLFLGNVRAAAQAAGVSGAAELLASLFMDISDQKHSARAQRIQFVRQVALPIALEILKTYEERDLHIFSPQELADGAAAIVKPVRDFFGPGALPDPRIFAYLEAPLRRAGWTDFSLGDLVLNIDLHAVDERVRKILGHILTDLGEIIHLYRCDILLLTGRPSRWPAVSAAPYAMLPLPVDRVIPLHEYRVGNWYPFASSLGRIVDPKTTVVVGAIICALAEGSIEGLAIDTSQFRLTSTARYIGEVNHAGRLPAAHVWFGDLDVLNPEEQQKRHTIEYNAPLPIGFRQLAAERWTTTRLYMLEYVNEGAMSRARNALPYTVTLMFTMKPVDEEKAAEQGAATIDRDEGRLEIYEAVNRHGDSVAGDLSIRLQTMPQDEGYWLDTGVLAIS